MGEGGGRRGIVKYRLFDHSDDVIDHTHLTRRPKSPKHLQQEKRTALEELSRFVCGRGSLIPFKWTVKIISKDASQISGTSID